MTIEIRITRTDDGMAEAQTIRNQVFVEEQKISLEVDLDGHADSAYDFVETGEVVGERQLLLMAKKITDLA